MSLQPLRNPYARRSNEPYRSSTDHIRKILVSSNESTSNSGMNESSSWSQGAGGRRPLATPSSGSIVSNLSSERQPTSKNGPNRCPNRFHPDIPTKHHPSTSAPTSTSAFVKLQSRRQENDHRKPPPLTTASESVATITTTLSRASNQQQSDLFSSTTNKPLLQAVLPHLRPFQREALEFAVSGKRYDRQFTESTTNMESAGANEYGMALSRSIKPGMSVTPVSPNGRILLADEMGLGKSVTSLAIMAYYQNEWPLLILCPASLRYTWPGEIEKFMPQIPPQAVHVCTGFQDVGFLDAASGRIKSDIQIVVATYSLFQQRSAVCHAVVGTGTNQQHQPLFRCIIADESHNLKQKDSQRSQLLLPVLQRCQRLVLLSGTPALARPVELWTQLSSLNPQLAGSFSEFTKRYCNPTRKPIGRGRYTLDLTGSANTAELNGKLQQVMVRRLKASVLTELPPKQRTIIPVSVSDRQRNACQRAMQELCDKRKAADMEVDGFVGYLNGSDGESSSKNPHWEAKAALMKAYQQTGIGKADAVADYLTTVWLPGNSQQSKILVFGHHQEVLDTIETALLKHNKSSVQHIRIDGRVPSLRRAQLVRQFQTSPQTRIGLLSMTAAGVGLTLTAADTVLFAELHWTPGVLAQAEDRVHRLGQTAAQVQILYMVSRDDSVSVDQTLWHMLGKKIHTLDQIVDGGGEEQQPYLFQAQEGTAAVPSAPVQSVQNELTDFFAAESGGRTRKKARSSSPAVRGSIQSFFLRKTAAEQQSCGSSDEPTTTCKKRPRSSTSRDMIAKAYSHHSESASTDSGRPLRAIELVDLTENSPQLLPPPVGVMSTVSRTNRKLKHQSITWSCSVCTLENAQPSNSSGYYACVVCSEPYVDGCSNRSPQPEDFPRQRDAEQHISLVSQSGGRKSDSSMFLTPSQASDSNEISDAVVVVDHINHDIDCDGDDYDLHRSGSSASFARTPLMCSGVKAKRRKYGDADARANGKPSALPEVIVLDFDEDSDNEDSRDHLASQIVPAGCLKFSVSKNTGRIAVHISEQQRGWTSTHVNFDVHDVISQDTSGRLLDAQITHAADSRCHSLVVEFNASNIDKVTQSILAASNHSPEFRRSCHSAIQSFVSNFLQLREVEKKALRDSGLPFAAGDLALEAIKLMNRSSAFKTDRYGGGAKERAVENAATGSATDADKLVLADLACAWCGDCLSTASVAGEATYCTEACAVEGRLRRGGRFASSNIRAILFSLEGGKCCLCGIDAHALFKQILALKPPERLNKLLSVNWKLPKTRKAMDSLLNDPTEGSFWQVDHIRAVAEGGGDASLDNLRTLCVPCHAVETAKLHRRLLLQSPQKHLGDDLEPQRKRKQLDIRNAFCNATVENG